MCRLFFDPTPQVTGAVLLEKQFTRLEEAFGGDGNGLALIGSDKPLIKGVKMRPSTLAGAAEEFAGPVMFHTRKASIGGVHDSLCQPFYIPHNTIVAHNGHWGHFEQGLDLLLRARIMKYIPMHLSDSLVGALLARSFGPGALINYVGEGVWLHANTYPTPIVTAIVNSGSFTINMTTGQAASQPVYWGMDADVRICGVGSVIQLFPEIKVISGSIYNRIPHEDKKVGKKKAKKHRRAM